MTLSPGRRTPVLILVLATLSALAVVPDLPHRHLDEPVYWGVIGFLLVVALVLRTGGRSMAPGTGARRVIRTFIVGVQVVYVANWIRWGGSGGQLLLQVGGLAVWLGLGWRAGRSDLALWAGCAAHALWDAVHFGRVGFIPEWYVAACLAADLGLAAFVALVLPGDGRASMDSPKTRAAGVEGD